MYTNHWKDTRRSFLCVGQMTERRPPEWPITARSIYRESVLPQAEYRISEELATGFRTWLFVSARLLLLPDSR